MKGFGLYEWVCYAAVLFGGFTWGLLGLFRIDLIQTFFGVGFLSRLVQILIGVAAGYLCYKLFSGRKDIEVPKEQPPVNPPT